MADPETTPDPGSQIPAAPSTDPDRPKSPAPGGEDEGARVLRSGPGEPHAGVRPGQPDQAAQQGFDRQRGDPHDAPSADVRDKGNVAGEKDFELQPPPA